MHTIKMPKAGKKMETGTIVRWLKGPGDSVKKADLLLTVESDEGLIEVEAGNDGILKKTITLAGTTVNVGDPIAELDENAGDSPVEQPSRKPETTPKGKDTVIPILMPMAGQSVEEATIVKWNVSPGATIQKGDIIFEIETDKATIDVEAVDSGRLARIVLPEGETSAVLEPVAYLAENDADVDAYLASQIKTQKEPVAEKEEEPERPAVTEPSVTEQGRIKASPAARKTARESGIELSTIGAGTGPEGRILSTDIPSTPGERVRRKMSPMRKAIARNLLYSKQTIPHFYTKLTIDAGPMYSLYQSERPKYKCSLNDMVVMACGKAVMEFSAFRSRVDNNDTVEFPSANIGIAVAIEGGLVVPVVVGVEKMTFQELAVEIRRIASSARNGKIEGMGQGVFTVTNLGMFGVDEFSAIINPPESAILAIGAMREDIIVSNSVIRPARVMTLTLSADHRIIDGVLAAKFMARLKEILEAPDQLIR